MPDALPSLRPVRPVPAPSVRPWAGTRLAAHGDHVGELWLAGPASVVPGADGETATLDELAARFGEAFVGGAGIARYGPRFPLLAKLIDAADWLSLQVHPDDALARELFGRDAVGKAEAWVVLDVAPGSELITGPAEGLAEAGLRAAIAGGTADRGDCRVRPSEAGEVLVIRPGTLHAIGGGTFLYELQQPSDLTFRVSDWGRAGRELHVEHSLRALDATAVAELRGRDFRVDPGGVGADALELEVVVPLPPVDRAPAGRSVEVVTSLRDTFVVHGPGWSEALTPLQTLVVPAAVDAYRITGPRNALVAIGTVP